MEIILGEESWQEAITPETVQKRPETTVNGGSSRRHSTLPSQAKWLQKTSKTTKQVHYETPCRKGEFRKKHSHEVSYWTTQKMMLCGDVNGSRVRRILRRTSWNERETHDDDSIRNDVRTSLLLCLGFQHDEQKMILLGWSSFLWRMRFPLVFPVVGWQEALDRKWWDHFDVDGMVPVLLTIQVCQDVPRHCTDKWFNQILESGRTAWTHGKPKSTNLIQGRVLSFVFTSIENSLLALE